MLKKITVLLLSLALYYSPAYATQSNYDFLNLTDDDLKELNDLFPDENSEDEAAQVVNVSLPSQTTYQKRKKCVKNRAKIKHRCGKIASPEVLNAYWAIKLIENFPFFNLDADNDEQLQIIMFVQKYSRITRDELVDLFEYTPAVIAEKIDAWMQRGFLQLHNAEKGLCNQYFSLHREIMAFLNIPTNPELELHPYFPDLSARELSVLFVFYRSKEEALSSIKIAQILRISPSGTSKQLKDWVTSGFLNKVDDKKYNRFYKLGDQYKKTLETIQLDS